MSICWTHHTKIGTSRAFYPLLPSQGMAHVRGDSRLECQLGKTSRLSVPGHSHARRHERDRPRRPLRRRRLGHAGGTRWSSPPKRMTSLEGMLGFRCSFVLASAAAATCAVMSSATRQDPTSPLDRARTWHAGSVTISLGKRADRVGADAACGGASTVTALYELFNLAAWCMHGLS